MNTFTFETTDYDEAVDFLRRVNDRGFGAVRAPESFHLRYRRTDHGLWTSDEALTSSGALRIEPYNMVSVVRVRAGHVLLTSGRDTFLFRKGDVFVSNDTAHPFLTEGTNLDYTLLRVPVDALRRAAEAAGAGSGNGRFTVRSRRPVTAQAGRHLTRVVSFAERHLAETDPPGHSPLPAAIEGLLAATVLTTFPNSLVPQSTVLRSRTDVPATVALALDFIARNADLRISVGDIAAHARVSTRALQMAFREHLATTPSEYLRRYRLDRIHQELTAAVHGDGTLVTQVAERWQLPESSRFVTYYRRVYAELPSHTLRRDP